MFALNYCVLCHSSNTDVSVGTCRLCHPCSLRISHLTQVEKRRHLRPPADTTSEHDRFELLTLFKYRDAVRSLILRAKINGDQSALSLITGLATNHPTTRSLVDESVVFMPAPSSLWGRFRGKLDIACHISKVISKESGAAFEFAPKHLYWRVKKRAKIKGRKVVNPFEPVEDTDQVQDEEAFEPIVIVDDIVTSGFTLCETALAVEKRHKDRRIILLAVADAI